MSSSQALNRDNRGEAQSQLSQNPQSEAQTANFEQGIDKYDSRVSRDQNPPTNLLSFESHQIDSSIVQNRNIEAKLQSQNESQGTPSSSVIDMQRHDRFRQTPSQSNSGQQKSEEKKLSLQESQSKTNQSDQIGQRSGVSREQSSLQQTIADSFFDNANRNDLGDVQESLDENDMALLQIEKNKKLLQLQILEMEEKQAKLKQLKMQRSSSRKSGVSKKSGSKGRQPEQIGQQAWYQNSSQVNRKSVTRQSKNFKEDDVAETIDPKRGYGIGPMRSSQDPGLFESDEEEKTPNKSSFDYFTKQDLTDNSPVTDIRAPVSFNQPDQTFQNDENSQDVLFERVQNPSIREMPLVNALRTLQEDSQQFDTTGNTAVFPKVPKVKKTLQSSKVVDKDAQFSLGGRDYGRRRSMKKQESEQNPLLNQSHEVSLPENFKREGDDSINPSVKQMKMILLNDDPVEPIHSEMLEADIVDEDTDQERKRNRKQKKDKRKKDRKGKNKKSKKSQQPEEEEQKTAQIHIQGRDEFGNPPDPPPQPEIYKRWIALQDGPTGASLIQDGGEKEEEQMNFFEPLSFKKLHRVISSLHPVDPETKERFNISDRITVKDYYAKLSDVCCCYALNQSIRQGAKFLKRIGKDKSNKIERPQSMTDLPDSGSSSSDAEEDKGITKCSQGLGDGATLYLQMMKTFAIMFCLLSILNLPIYIIYEQNTSGNILNKLDQFFKYFTIGNLGQMTTKCGYSDFDYKFFKKPEENYTGEVTVDCGEGYIGQLKEFGFLYKKDKVYGGDSDGNATCRHIEEPMDYYKMPPLVPIICNIEEMEGLEYQICLIDQKFQNLEITEEQMYIEKDKIQPIFQYNYDHGYMGRLLGSYKFENRAAIEEGSDDETNYAWIIDAKCDQSDLYWNTKDSQSFKIFPEWEQSTDDESMKKKFLGFTFDDSDEEVTPPFSKATVQFAEGEEDIQSITMDDGTEFIAVGEFAVDFNYQSDHCDPEDSEQDYYTSKEYYHHSSIWKFDGEFPEQPKVDQELTFTNIDPLCKYENRTNAAKANRKFFKDKESLKMFTKYFEENCYYKQKCVLSPWKMGYQIGDQIEGKTTPITEKDMGLFGLISDDCKLRMSDPRYLEIMSMNYIGIFGCKYDDVGIPLTDKRLHKEVIGVFIVCLDFSTILVMMFFFAKINTLNNEFLANMDDLRVQMKDFGVKIDNVKLDKHSQDSRIVKMKIWQHFKEILKDKKDDLNDMQCIDVCLSIYTQPSIQSVFRMQEIQLEINKIKDKLVTNQYSQSEIPDKQEQLEDLYQKQKRFEARYRQLVQKKIYKEGDKIQVKRVTKSERMKEIQYIFVVFKNCDTSGEVLDIYKKEQLAVRIIQSISSREHKQDQKVMQKHLPFGKNLDIKPILEPDEIIWQNLAFTGDEQRARKYAISVISLFFLLFNTLFTMYLKGYKVFMNKKIPSAVGCPDTIIEKVDAYKDYLKSIDDDDQTKSAGLLACYCKKETSLWLPWTLIGNNFQDFSNLNPNTNQDKKNYCLQWWALQWLKEISLFFVDTSAVFINEIVADFFQKMGEFQKKHTKIEEQITCFKQIFTQEFINMGIIVLITSFDQLGITDAILGELSSNSNVYKEFEPSWYMDYGNKICVFIFMSAFLVNSKDIVKFTHSVVSRFIDRGFKMNLKLDPDDEDDDTPNSKIRIQSDLEQLYKGKIFKGEKAYSRMMSTMYVVQMYSSGMPILYLNGFVFYFVTFWVNKFLLIYYYQKSRTLTRTIPLFTMEYLKYGLLLHMIMGCFMLTNKKSFITKTMTQGVTPLFDAEKRHDRLIEEGTLSAEEANRAERYIDRYRFAHQQLLFLFLIFWVIFYFIGRTAIVVFSLLLDSLVKFLKKKLMELYQFSKKQIELQNKKKKQVHDMNEGLGLNLVEMVAAEKERIHEEREEAERLETIAQKAELAAAKTDKERIAILIKHRKDDIQEEEDREAEEEAIRQEHNDKIKQQEQQQENKGGVLQEMLNKMKQKNKEEEQKKLRKQIQQKRFERPDYSDNIIGEMTTENLSNFYERCKRELEDFWDVFQTDQEIQRNIMDDEIVTKFKQLFYETLWAYRITDKEFFEYQDFLKQRIVDCEEVIDKYFKLLQPTIIKKMKAGFDRDRNRRKKDNKEGTPENQLQQKKFEEWFFQYSDDVNFNSLEHYPWTKKMKLLIEFQDELIQADLNRKENRQGIKDICRMTGSLSQSYFIFDAQQYQVGRKIYYGLEQEQEVVEEENLNDILAEQQQQDQPQQQDQDGATGRKKNEDGGATQRSGAQSVHSRYTARKQSFDRKVIQEHLSQAGGESARRKEGKKSKMNSINASVKN